MDEIEKAQKAESDRVLADQGKFKELAERNKGEADTAKKAHADAVVEFRLELEAVKSGAIDPADVLALADRSGIKVDGKTVTGAKEAVEALAKAKPHLFKPADDDAGDKGGYRHANDRVAPLRKTDSGTAGMTAAEKIAYGLANPGK